jgi:exosortase
MVAVWMAFTPLKGLLTTASQSEYYSHILLIPLVSGYFIYSGRKKIFEDTKYSYPFGIPLLVIGILLYGLGWHPGNRLNQNDYSSLMTFSAIVFWIGAFVIFYGTEAFRKAIFPLLFLVFMIPIPSLLMEKTIFILQMGSAEATTLLFKAANIPFLQEGFTYHLPGMSIEIAKECSGIRSSLGLFITCIVAGHVLLRTGWKKFVAILFVFPITVLKNGIRIVTLSSLAVYVDETFLTQSFLHHSGGFLFYIPALFLLGLIFWWLRKSEVSPGKGSP